MILSGVKLRIASRRAGFLPNRAVTFGEERPIKKIGVILDSFDEVVEQSFQNFVQDFKLNAGSAEFVHCLPKASKNRTQDRIIFNERDLSWSGKVINPRVAAFLDNRYDLVICFTKGENKFGEFLLSTIDAGLKVGREQQKEYLYDIRISCSFEEVEIFISEVKKCLKILNRTS